MVQVPISKQIPFDELMFTQKRLAYQLNGFVAPSYSKGSSYGIGDTFKHAAKKVADKHQIVTVNDLVL